MRVALFFVFLLSILPTHAAEIRVAAAASLSDVLTEIAAGYERESGDAVVLNFGASSLLARQIEQGAPADVFVSADDAKMDQLAKNGLIMKETRRDLLSNTLVLVVPHSATAMPKDAAALKEDGIRRIALAEPETVPAGIYAKQFLKAANLWEALREKMIPLENVRAVLAAVESGNAEAGFVYRTDALVSKKVKVAVEIPASESLRIVYPVALVKDAKPEARKFLDYLSGDEPKRLFKQYGFTLLEK